MRMLCTKKQIRGHHIANLDPLEIANSALIGKNKRAVIHNSYRFGKNYENLKYRKHHGRSLSHT